MAETYTLVRNGRRPARFTGTRLAASSGREGHNMDLKRWYDLAVYETNDGGFVVQWHYHSLWGGEEDHHRVEMGSTLAYVVSELEDFDPTAWITGYRSLIAQQPAYNKPGHASGYYERQQALERQIRERYARQVSELCATLAETHDIAEDL